MELGNGLGVREWKGREKPVGKTLRMEGEFQKIRERENNFKFIHSFRLYSLAY